MIFNVSGSAGGGTSLGFEIVGGTIRPDKPTQNMVWVNTDIDVTGYALSATEPENPVEGMLWVTIANSSSVKSVFTVDKEWVTLYLVSVKQYISGAWTDKTAMSYQNGVWISWIVYIHSIGTGYNSLKFGSYSLPSSNSNTFEVTNDAISIGAPNTLANFIIDSPIDLTAYSRLEFEVKVDNAAEGIGVGFTSSNAVDTAGMQPNNWSECKWSGGSNVWTSASIDLTAVNKKMYFRIGSWNGTISVRNIRFV